MAINDTKSSKIPLDVSINCDPIGENVWPFLENDAGESITDQQLISNTGYHFEGGIASLHQVQTTNGNSPVYSYVTENGNVIDLRSAGQDPTSLAPMNGVYLDGRLLDYVPAHGLESMQAIGNSYDDLILTDGNPVGMKITSNSTGVPVSGSGGTAWTFRTTTAPAGGWISVAYGNGLWVALAYTNSTTAGIATSSDGGLTWTFKTTTTPGGPWRSISYGNGLWVALAESTSTTSSMATSSDGSTWSFVTTPSTTGIWQRVSYGNGLWVAVTTAASPTSGIATSVNGSSWSFTTSPVPSGAWNSLAYGNGRWVATANTSATSTGIATSIDGLNWSFTTTPSPAGNWRSVSYGNGLWVAVAYTTSTTRGIATSLDGLAWTFTTTTAPASLGWSSVSYGNGLWVALSYATSTTASIATSTNGISWTFQTTSAPGGPWTDSFYGNGKWVSISYTTSTTVGIATSPISYANQFSVILDEIDPDGNIVNTVTRTITNAGFAKPVALIKQALGNNFTWASTQYFLAADSATTYNIFDQSGVKQLTTSIPATWASGAPKYVWACKFASKNDYFVCAIGATGTAVIPASYMITSTGGSAPYTNTNTATTYSWAVMQSKNGYNRVVATGQYNATATTGNLINFLGYTAFTASYTGASIPSNSVTNTADLATQPSASSYAYVDVVHTDYHHYYSGYDSPGASTALFTDTPNSSGSLNGFGRLSFANTTDFGGKNPFEFRLNVFKPYGTGSTTYPESPQFISVGSPYGKDSKCAIGVPLSSVGEFDPSFGPQIGANWDTVCWRWNQVYYIAKISTSPARPIQKITSNLYKINSISPINVVNVSSKSLVLGSNDYTSSFLISGGTNSGTSFGSSNIAWSNQSQTAANSIDLGGVAFFNSGAYSTTPLGAFLPTAHQGSNYYFLNFYSGTVSSPATITLNNVWKADGQSVTGSSLLSGFQNQLSALGTTYIANTTLLPLPLGVRYQGYTIGTNSSATSLAFMETFLTAGYQGITLTSEWDGYILGNQLPMNSVSFALFNVPYLFDGRYIYRLTINNGGVQVPLTTMARADGLVYMATSSNAAFFFDSFDNSVWAFDGGATLTKIKRLDGFGSIQNGNFSTYENTLFVNTQSAIVTMRDGIWSAIPKATTMTPDGSESYMRLYDTTSGTVFGNSVNWWKYQYFNPDTVGTTTPITGFTQVVSVVPLNLQTGYIGPNSNRRMVLSNITFEVYNTAKSLTELSVTIYGYDQDGAYTQQVQKITIQPSKWLLGGLYRHRVQPKNDRILATSIQIQCATPIRVYGLTYHWTPDAQAINQGNQSS